MGHEQRDDLAERVRACLGPDATGDERSMFGGIAFMVGGHMAVCAGGDGGLLVRTTDVSTHVREDGSGPVTPMIMAGRESKTWLRVAPEAIADDLPLRRWVMIGVAVAGSLPPKSGDEPDAEDSPEALAGEPVA